MNPFFIFSLKFKKCQLVLTLKAEFHGNHRICDVVDR